MTALLRVHISQESSLFAPMEDGHVPTPQEVLHDLIEYAAGFYLTADPDDFRIEVVEVTP